MRASFNAYTNYRNVLSDCVGMSCAKRVAWPRAASYFSLNHGEGGGGWVGGGSEHSRPYTSGAPILGRPNF